MTTTKLKVAFCEVLVFIEGSISVTHCRTIKLRNIVNLLISFVKLPAVLRAIWIRF